MRRPKKAPTRADAQERQAPPPKRGRPRGAPPGLPHCGESASANARGAGEGLRRRGAGKVKDRDPTSGERPSATSWLSEGAFSRSGTRPGRASCSWALPVRSLGRHRPPLRTHGLRRHARTRRGPLVRRASGDRVGASTSGVGLRARRCSSCRRARGVRPPSGRACATHAPWRRQRGQRQRRRGARRRARRARQGVRAVSWRAVVIGSRPQG